MNSPLFFMVAEAMKSKSYPTDVKEFLYGLFATLHLRASYSAKDMEKIIFFAFRNGYVLGAASQGMNAQEIQDRLPDFGLDEQSEDAKR